MKKHDFAPRRIGELLDDAIALVIANWRTIVPVAAVIVLPVAAAYSVVASFYIRSFVEILGGGASAFSSTTPSSAEITILLTATMMQGLGLLYAGSKAVFDAGMYSSADELLRAERRPLKEMLSSGFRSALPLIAVQLLAGLLAGTVAIVVGVGVALIAFGVMFVSPIAGAIGVVIAELAGLTAGLVAGAFLFLAAPIAVIEKDIIGSLTRSFALVRRHFWRIVLVVIAAGLLGAQFESALAAPTIVRSIITGVQSPESLIGQMAWGWKVFDGLAQGIAMALVLPFTTAVSLLTYFDLRARDEGMDLVVRARALLPG